jgi:hypothetical protein
MKEGQVLIAKNFYIGAFAKGEEYTIFRVENYLGDWMATVKDKDGRVVTWPLKQFEIDINFTIK